MPLKIRISDDVKAAMRGGDGAKRDALRLLQAAIKQKEVDERIELDDAAVLAVIEKMLKQRRESIAQFESAGRADLADKEKFEAGLLHAYMPQQLSGEEIARAVDAAVAAAGAASAKDIGKVMAQLKAELAGRADMSKVSALVRAKLG